MYLDPVRSSHLLRARYELSAPKRVALCLLQAGCNDSADILSPQVTL
jgi:hypothetical protein